MTGCGARRQPPAVGGTGPWAVGSLHPDSGGEQHWWCECSWRPGVGGKGETQWGSAVCGTSQRAAGPGSAEEA